MLEFNHGSWWQRPLRVFPALLVLPASRGAFWFFVLGAAVAACGPPRPKPVDLAGGTRKYSAPEYNQVLLRWTRHTRLQNDFDKVAPFVVALDVRATFKSWDWRWAYSERYAEFYRIPEADKEQFREQQLQEAGEFHDFYVFATASREQWVNFTKPEKTLWRIVVFDDRGREIEPSERRMVRLPLATEAAFFPYVATLDEPFAMRVMLRFPTHFPDGTPTISPTAKSITLRFAGPLGTADLVWKTVLESP